MEDDFLCCAAAGQRCNLICHFFFGHQETFAFLDLHGITKRTAGTGNDCDLVYRCGVRLQGGDKGMTDFMIGNDQFFFFGEHAALFLVACDNNLDAFFEVCLCCKTTTVADCTQSSFVDDVGEFSAGGTGSSFCDFMEVYIICNLDLTGMYLQDIFAAL